MAIVLSLLSQPTERPREGGGQREKEGGTEGGMGGQTEGQTEGEKCLALMGRLKKGAQFLTPPWYTPWAGVLPQLARLAEEASVWSVTGKRSPQGIFCMGV